MKKKTEEKQVKIRTIIFTAIILLIVYFSGVAVLIYGFGIDNRLTQKTSVIFPYPVAFLGGTDFITVSKLREQLKSSRMFYEGQDFSDMGMRVDFATEDGKKRLKIKEKNILNKLIEDKIIEKEAKKRGLIIVEEDISQEVSRKMQEYGSEDYLRENLERLYGWTISDFEENIVRPDMYKEKLYQDIKSKDKVMVEARKKIDSALTELEKGENFSDVAKRYSEGESAKNDGELGWFSGAEMLPKIAQNVFSLKKGERTNVIESSIGYHIISVENRKTEDGVEKLQLRQVFVRTSSFSDWLDKRIKDSNVYVLYKDLYWNKSDGQVKFRNGDLNDFEDKLEENSPGDISVLF